MQPPHPVGPPHIHAQPDSAVTEMDGLLGLMAGGELRLSFAATKLNTRGGAASVIQRLSKQGLVLQCELVRTCTSECLVDHME